MQLHNRALIALGANLPFGDLAGAELLQAALDTLAEEGLVIEAVSSAYANPAWPRSDQPDFVNAAALLNAEDLDAEALYARLCAVELKFGRERRARWSARTLDLDIIDMDQPGPLANIQIPHPRARERAFVLAPALEIAPDWRFGAETASLAELLAAAPDRAGLSRLAPLRKPVQSRIAQKSLDL